MPDEAFKPLGVVSIVFVFAVTTFIMLRWPKGTKAVGISGHAGAQSASYWLFASALTVGGTGFFLFLWRWLGPAIGAWWPFYVLAVLGYVLQLLTAWLPDRSNGDRISRLHANVAFYMARVMLLLVGLLALAPHINGLVRTLTIVGFVVMGFLWYLFTFVKSTRQHFLVYQNAYIVSFYIIMIVATYLR